MAQVIKATFQLRRGLLEAWEKNNPILAKGEPSFVLDKNALKIGDGVTPWKELDYIGLNQENLAKAIEDYFEKNPEAGGIGKDGRGIVSITRTEGNGMPGTTDIYTILYSDSTTSTFSIYNGKDGQDGISASLTIKYARSMSNSIEPTTWQNSIPTLTPTEKYLWAQFTKTEGFSSSVWTGVVGIYGDTGPVGDDYVLTDADKAEIAEMAADLVEVPELSGGKADFVVQDTPPEDTSVLWVDTDDNNDDGFQEAVNAALAQAKESGEFDGDDYVLTPDDKTEIAEMAADLVEVPESSGGIAVTGAKVGQTVTIAAVDDNGVPTAWEAVDFPSEGEYELIETVTLQEDIDYVYLTAYPDGNDYALKALFVRVTTPGDDAQRAGYVLAYGDRNMRIKLGGGYAPRMVNTNARVTTFECRVSHGRWESILYGSVEGETNSDTPTNYPRMQGLYSTEQYPVIASVQVYCKERTSAGTVIEIWGVRA